MDDIEINEKLYQDFINDEYEDDMEYLNKLDDTHFQPLEHDHPNVIRKYAFHSGLPIDRFRCKGCSIANTNTLSNRIQKQKIIQKVVRVYSTQYSDNLSALSVYEKPLYPNAVNWNQMSDRIRPHIQRSIIPTRANSLKSSITSSRPGCTPGGVGVDIKHNSYHRYLQRIKGKAPYRRGIPPPQIAYPELPFDPAFPIYGGKLFKLNIVNNCRC